MVKCIFTRSARLRKHGAATKRNLPAVPSGNLAAMMCNASLWQRDAPDSPVAIIVRELSAS